MTEGRKSLRVEYFARLREKSGVAAEELLTRAKNPDELLAELVARYGFRVDMVTSRVAVNDAVATWETPLHDGDRIVFLTPFGGG